MYSSVPIRVDPWLNFSAMPLPGANSINRLSRDCPA